MYYTYILANKPGGTFYVGITNNLQKRIFEHKEELVEGFTKKYGIKLWFITKSTKTLKRQ